jgi:hypothetical protein
MDVSDHLHNPVTLVAGYEIFKILEMDSVPE